jgi:hypothetical protein
MTTLDCVDENHLDVELVTVMIKFVSGQDMKLTTHFHQVLRLRISSAIHSLSCVYVSMVCCLVKPQRKLLPYPLSFEYVVYCERNF